MAEYEVTVPVGEVLMLPRAVANHKDKDGNVLFQETEGVPRHAGDIVPEEEIAAHVLAAYEAGEAHICGLLSLVGGKKKAPAKAKVEDDDARMRRESALADQQARVEAEKAKSD